MGVGHQIDADQLGLRVPLPCAASPIPGCVCVALPPKRAVVRGVDPRLVVRDVDDEVSPLALPGG